MNFSTLPLDSKIHVQGARAIRKNSYNPNFVEGNPAYIAIDQTTGRTLVDTQFPPSRDLMDLRNVILLDTTETILIPAAPNEFHDIYGFIITNTSVTGVQVDFRDSLGGNIILSLIAPAQSTTSIPTIIPLKQSIVNSDWTVTLGAAVTDVRITVTNVRSF